MRIGWLRHNICASEVHQELRNDTQLDDIKAVNDAVCIGMGFALIYEDCSLKTESSKRVDSSGDYS